MSKSAIRSNAYRVITAIFGLMFTAITIAILVVFERTIGALHVAGVIGILGFDAIANAFRNKPSLLSRIGPLP